MSGTESTMAKYDQLKEIMHIVSQIEKLKVNVQTKLQSKRYPAQEVLDVMADAMQEVDEITRINSQSSGWIQIYDELRGGRIPDNLCDKISAWQKETLNWVDHMESRRLIRNLEKEVQRQGELIEKLLSVHTDQKICE